MQITKKNYLKILFENTVHNLRSDIQTDYLEAEFETRIRFHTRVPNSLGLYTNIAYSFQITEESTSEQLIQSFNNFLKRKTFLSERSLKETSVKVLDKVTERELISEGIKISDFNQEFCIGEFDPTSYRKKQNSEDFLGEDVDKIRAFDPFNKDREFISDNLED